MPQILLLSFAATILFSCKKDKVPKEEPCTNVELTGNREAVVGTWRWYSTRVYQSTSTGNIPLDYTPQNQGFEYYCVITSDGKYKGYRDSVLVHDIVLTRIFVDNNSVQGKYSLSALMNCGDEQLNMTVFSSDSTEDVLALQEFPLNINETYKYSTYNRFKRD